MTYETIDWEAEALWVARAFDAIDECSFKKSHGGQWLMSHSFRLELDAVALSAENGLYLGCAYFRDHRMYGIATGDIEGDTIIRFDWNGQVKREAHEYVFAAQLAKGLFHLDLLTPEVEAMIRLNISAHQKLEWALEYQQKYPRI